MALELMSKAFKLNNTTLTNNNQRSSSNPCYSQIAHSGMNIDQDKHMLMVDDNVGNQFSQNAVQNVGLLVWQNVVQNQGTQNVRNQNGLSVILGIENQNGNGNVVAARAKGNGAYEEIERIERLQAQLGDQKGKSKDTPCASNTLDPLYQKLENENVELEFQVLNYAKENDHLKTTYKNLFDSIKVTRAQTKAIINSLQDKLHDTIYENAKLKAQLFDKVSEQKDSNKVTPFPKSMIIPKVGKSNALSKPVTSNSAPSSRESTVVNNERVIAPGIFRINPFKPPRVDNFVPNKHVKASVKTKPITVSQPHVITKNDVNSKTNGFSPKDVKSTTRTRRPQPRNNPKSDKVPFKSKSSCLSNKLEKIEENHRSLQSFNYPDHTSSECNNIKLTIRNEKSEVICATCKQCLITANHDDCVLQYVNGMKSRKKNQSANVSKSANQKKHKPRVWKPKKVGSKERLASPKPSTPRSCLRWSPTGRMFDLKGKIIATRNLSVNLTDLKVIMLALLTLRNLSTKGFQVQLSL
ncbi:hypothetical protein Tco_1081175 [Tanacetum coccineum]|uniref:Uncharacterized protein n=1 Tax=Tanacetum coccineum TaxID=301880 RepID=A0ABQ5HX96_9ASTR